jgi:hypothetical protein
MNPILTRVSLALFTALVLAPTGARAEPPAATRSSAPARPPAADKPFVGRLEYRSVAQGGEGRVVLAFAPEGARVELELRAAGLPISTIYVLPPASPGTAPARGTYLEPKSRSAITLDLATARRERLARALGWTVTQARPVDAPAASAVPGARTQLTLVDARGNRVELWLGDAAIDALALALRTATTVPFLDEEQLEAARRAGHGGVVVQHELWPVGAGEALTRYTLLRVEPRRPPAAAVRRPAGYSDVAPAP